MQKIPAIAHFGDVKGLVSRGAHLYSCGDRTVKVWNETLKLEHEIGCESSPTSLCVGQGGELFIGREDKKLSLWQSSLESGIRVLGEQDGAVSAIARLGKLLVSGSDQGSIFLWGEKGVSQTLLGHAARVRALFLAQPTVAVSASSDGTIKVWDLQKAACQETLGADPKGVWALAPYNEHQFFAGGEEENVVRLWDLRRVERCIGALRLDLGTITTLCPMGLYLGVGGTRRQIHVIDLNQLTAVSTVSLDNKYPTCLTTFAGKLAVGCNTGTLELYSLQIPGGPSPLIAQPHVSICFRCPVPPPYFKGRAQELQSLKEAFQTSSRVAIQGLGGTGKTSLARKFVHDQRSCYPLICTLSGNTPQTLEQGLLDLAKKLKVKGDTTEKTLSNLKRYFEQLSTPFLLIYDGVDSEASFETLGKHLPSGKGTLLLTTRREPSALRLGFTSSPLKAWSKEEAANYLLSVTQSQEKDHALILVEKLGSLPLALEQAAFYIKDNCSIQEYLILFDNCRLRLFSDTLSALNPSRTILTTWNISLESIETAHRCSLAAPLLSFACFLGPEPLPFSLFEAWLNIGEKEGGLLELSRTLRLLKDCSLLTLNERGYVFQPLFQEVIRDSLPPEKKIACLSQALEVLMAYVKDKDPHQPTNWPLYQHLSSVCETLKQACEAYMSATFFPLTYPAPLFRSYTRYLLNQGLHRPAYLLAIFSLHLARKLEQEKRPDGTPNVAASLNFLGLALSGQGKYGDAEKLHRAALEIRCRLYPTRENPAVAASLNNLGNALSNQRKYGEAEKSHRAALEIRGRLYPTRDHPDVAASLNNLGNALRCQGKYGEAEKSHRAALEIRCRLYPTREHPDVAASLGNLGNVLSDQGKYGEAEKFLREAHQIHCRLYPTKEHPDVTWNLNNLIRLLEKMGRHAEIEELRSSMKKPG